MTEDGRSDLGREDEVARVLRRPVRDQHVPPFSAVEARLQRRTPRALVALGAVGLVVLGLVLGSALAERRGTVGQPGPVPTAATAPAVTSTPSPSAPAPTPTPAASPPPSVSPTPSPTPITLPRVAQISAPSANVVWALVADSRLFVSTDRGDTWQERSIPRRDLPNLEISFVSDREGWAMSPDSPATQCQSQSVRLWHTADGAATWAPVTATGIPEAQCKESLSFVSSGTGFISAWDPNHAPTILQTRDGGKTWSGATLADPPGFTSRDGGFTLRAGRVRAFGTAMFVEATGNAGDSMRRYVFVWQSNAPTWGYAATVPNAEDAFAFAGDPGGGDLRWLLVGPPGASQESTDGGQTWHAFTTDYQQAAPIAPVVTFADGRIGYATVRGQIQRTTDGGAHWTPIKTPGTS